MAAVIIIAAKAQPGGLSAPLEYCPNHADFQGIGGAHPGFGLSSLYTMCAKRRARVLGQLRKRAELGNTEIRNHREAGKLCQGFVQCAFSGPLKIWLLNSVVRVMF